MASKDGSGGHVMISYQWDCQPLMKKVAAALKSAGYNVWMDIEQMAGSLNKAMAKAVQGADVVLIAMSSKYQLSHNCEKEANYADQLKKDIIPLLVEKPFTADDWLGIITGQKLYYDLTNPDKFNDKINDLIKALGDRGKIKDKEDKENPTQNQPTVQMQNLSMRNSYPAEDDQIELVYSANKWVEIQPNVSAVSSKPRLSAAKCRQFLEHLKPTRVDAVKLEQVNLGLCHQELFNFTSKCRNSKRLILYDVTDDTGKEGDVVAGLTSAVNKLDQLRSLDIRDVNLGGNAVHLFRQARCPDLRILSLYDTHMSAGGAALVSCLSTMPRLTYLDLFNSGMSQTEMKAVIECLPKSCPKLVFLDNSDVKLAYADFKPVCQLNKLKSLGFLAEDADHLVPMLKHLPPNIELLYLRHVGGAVNRLDELISQIRSLANLRYLVVNEGALPRLAEKRVVEGVGSQVRFVNSDTDPEGWDDYQEELGQFIHNCFSSGR